MKVQIIEGEIRPDPIHLLVCIPRSMSAAQFTGIRKGKSALMMCDRHANLRWNYGSRNFWSQGD